MVVCGEYPETACFSYLVMVECKWMQVQGIAIDNAIIPSTSSLIIFDCLEFKSHQLHPFLHVEEMHSLQLGVTSVLAKKFLQRN